MDMQKLLLNALGMQPEDVIIEKYLTNTDQLSTSITILSAEIAAIVLSAMVSFMK